MFYKRRNFYDFFEFVIFTQNSTFLESFEKSKCCSVLVGVIYSQDKNAPYHILWCKKNVAVFTSILVIQNYKIQVWNYIQKWKSLPISGVYKMNMIWRPQYEGLCTKRKWTKQLNENFLSKHNETKTNYFPKSSEVPVSTTETVHSDIARVK